MPVPHAWTLPLMLSRHSVPLTHVEANGHQLGTAGGASFLSGSLVGTARRAA